MSTNDKVTLFISYSHLDEEFQRQLGRHLHGLDDIIAPWHDRKILGGDEWATKIDNNLKSADIILLLVSENFLASNYCKDVELDAAIKQQNTGKSVVLPVIFAPCVWKHKSFGKFNALPRNGTAISIWEKQGLAYVDVINGIREIATDLLVKRQKKREEKDEAKKRYKKELEAALHDHEIDALEKKGLREAQEDFGLTDEEVAEVGNTVYGPKKEYEGKLKRYEVDLNETLTKEYPLSDKAVKMLKQRQIKLGIKDDDAELLHALAEKEHLAKSAGKGAASAVPASVYSAAVAEIRFCIKCGNMLRAGDKFCNFCGYPAKS
jgi:hypothetical protein